MTNLLILIAATLAVGMFFVVLPFAYQLYHSYRARKVVTCPETHGLAEVTLKPGRAALTALVTAPVLRVKSCTLWPRKKGCSEHCVREAWRMEERHP